MAYIDKVAVKNGNTTTNYKVATSLYGTCDTAAATAEKVVTLTDFNDFSTGVTIKVKFTNSNTASNPTLNVNSKGAKSIYRFGTTVPGTNAKTSWNTGAIVSFTYDGSAWIMNDWINDDTTYTLPQAATSAPVDVTSATAAIGSSEKYAREDHKHHIATVSASSAGIAPKGAAVSSQSQSTKFLREDGSWTAPSYTTNTDTKVTQTATSNNANYEVLFSGTADNETRTETAKKNSNLKFNPSTGNLQATTYNGLTLATTGSLTNDSSIIPNSKTVKTYVDSMVANATHFRGSFNATNGKIDGGSSSLVSIAEIIGDMYVCDTPGTYLGTTFEIGDSIIFKREVDTGTAPVAADIVAVESTVSVSVPSTIPAPSAGATATLATIEGVDIQIKLPNDSDTKNTAGSTDTSSKIFLVGATSQAANPQTYSHDTAYVGTDGCLYSGGTKVLTAHQDISGKVNKSGDTMTGRLTTAKPINPIITGTGTTAQNKGAGVSPRYFPAKWTFNNGQTLMDGDVITIKIPCAGHDYGVFISIDNGITYKPISIAGTSRLTTHYPAGAYLTLIYKSDGATNSVYPAEGADAKSNITGGCWLVLNYYDSGNTYDRNCFNANIKACGTKILSGNIIVGINGEYHHLKEGTAFGITYPILYLAADCNANSTTTNTYDILNFTITTTQNITLAAYKPVYIKGTLSGTIFTPESTTPLTQTIPSSADGKYYILLGNATSSTTVFLTERHEIYAYKNGVFGQITNDALSVNGYTVAKSVPSDAKFTDTTYTAATAAPGKVASASAQGSSTNYARQDHTHGIDLATGDNNGQVKIAGTNVSVKGLGSLAYLSSISADYITSTGYLNIQPENQPTLIPFINNDIAFLTKRGGSYIVKYDDVVQSVKLDSCFDGTPSYGYAISGNKPTTIVIELTLHKVFSWGNIIYCDMGSYNWRAKNVKIEVMNSNYSGDTWSQKYATTTLGNGHFYTYTSHTPVGASNSGGGFNKVRFTFSDFAHDIFRIAQLGIYNYSSSGVSETYLSKGGDAVYGSIYPYTTNDADLGTTTKYWNNAYITNINGVAVGESPSFTDTKVTVNTIQPAEATNYYLTLASSSGTGILGGNLGVKAHILKGTTEAEGIGGLTLGNSTATGTDGNQKGYIYMYSTTNKYGTIEQGDITSNVTHTLPSSTGTLLNDDNYSTYVKKVNSTVATDTSYKYGGIPFYNNWNNTSEVKDILHNDGISYSYKNGTASAVGESYIQLGNNIASGTAGNKKGFVLLYGQNTGYTILTTNQNNTSNYNLKLPTKSGTLATVDDVQTRLGILKWRNTNTVTVGKTITITGNFYRSAYVGSPTSIIRFFKPQLSDYANNKLLEANLFSAYTTGSGGTHQVDFVSGKNVYTVASNNDYSGFFDIGSISTGITSSVSTPEEQSLTITMTMRFWAGAALMIEYDQSVYTITIT